MNKSEIILNYYNHLEKLSDDISNINIQLQSISLLLKKNQQFLEKQNYLKNNKVILLKGGDGFDDFITMNNYYNVIIGLFKAFSHDLNRINLLSYIHRINSNYEEFTKIKITHFKDHFVFFKLNQNLNNLFIIIFEIIDITSFVLSGKLYHKEYVMKEQFIKFSYEILNIYNNFIKIINKYINNKIVETETFIGSKIDYSGIKSELENTKIPDVDYTYFHDPTEIDQDVELKLVFRTKETYIELWSNDLLDIQDLEMYRYITYICNMLFMKEINIKSSFILLSKSEEIPWECGYTYSSVSQFEDSRPENIDKYIFIQYQKPHSYTYLNQVLVMLLTKIKEDKSPNYNNIILLISLIFESFYTFYLLHNILRISNNYCFETILVEKLENPEMCKYYIYDKIYTFYKYYNVRISDFSRADFMIDRVDKTDLLLSEYVYMDTYKIIMNIILPLIHTLDKDFVVKKNLMSIVGNDTRDYRKIIKNLIYLILNFDYNALYYLITNYIIKHPSTYNTLTEVDSYLDVGRRARTMYDPELYDQILYDHLTMYNLLKYLLNNPFIQTALLKRQFDPNFINQDYSYNLSLSSQYRNKYLKYKNKYLNEKYV